MPRIKTDTPDFSSSIGGQPTSGLRGPSEGITSFGTREAGAIARGLSDFARVSAGIVELKKAEDKRIKLENDSREFNKAAIQIRSDWSKRFRELEENPSENVFNQVQEEFEEYERNMIANASNPEVAAELELELAKQKIKAFESAHRLELQTKAINWAGDFDEMLMQADNLAYESKDLEGMIESQNQLDSFINQGLESGRIKDKATAEALRNKVDQLAYTWGLATVSEDPQAVLDALDTEGLFNGVSARNRETLRATANRVLESQDEIDKSLLRQSFESDYAQRLQTGAGSAFNYDQAVEAFGKTEADQMQRQLDYASELYSVNVDIKGANATRLSETLNKYQPKANPTSDRYAEELQMYESVRKMVVQAQADKESDPYTYFSEDPAVQALIKKAQENPDDAELQQGIQNMILGLQKADKSLLPSEYAVMPAAAAKQFVETFNAYLDPESKDDWESVLADFVGFANSFGDNTPYALNQIAQIKNGDKIASAVNPLMWHMGNRSVFKQILSAVRKDHNEVMNSFDSEIKKDFLDNIATNSQYLNYQASIFASNFSPEASDIVFGTRDTFLKFARDYVLTGGTVDEAAEQFFSHYTFGTVNDIPFNRPRTFTSQDGKVHVLTPDQVELSNEWLQEEIYDMAFNKLGNLDPESILPYTDNYTEDQLKEDMKDQILDSGFWATSEDELGVYLYIKGELSGTSVRAKDKQGNPIFIPFDSTLQGRNRIRRTDGVRMDSRTDDRWWDRMFRGIGTLR